MGNMDHWNHEENHSPPENLGQGLSLSSRCLAQRRQERHLRKQYLAKIESRIRPTGHCEGISCSSTRATIIFYAKTLASLIERGEPSRSLITFCEVTSRKGEKFSRLVFDEAYMRLSQSQSAITRQDRLQLLDILEQCAKGFFVIESVRGEARQRA